MVVNSIEIGVKYVPKNYLVDGVTATSLEKTLNWITLKIF